MSLPSWADHKLSQSLPQLRAKGETQEMEFKREFPKQGTDLAKEIAAFATSNTGTIIIGVEDSGDLAGIEGMNDVQERDKLMQRLEGICSGSVKPAITPVARWAVESEATVLAVTVPKGSEPIYYSQGKPYLRHLTTSRPAEPHEVVEIVKQSLWKQSESKDSVQDELSTFYSELETVLNQILAWSVMPADTRYLNPWFEYWRADYTQAASRLREIAAKDMAIQLSLEESIHAVAQAADDIAEHQSMFGDSSQLNALSKHAFDLAQSLKENISGSSYLSAEAEEHVRNQIALTYRRLEDLAGRAGQMTTQGRTQELKSEVGSLGRKLVMLSLSNLDGLGSNIAQDLQDVAQKMWLVETAEVYMDGGQSRKRLVNEVLACFTQLKTLIQTIENNYDD